MSGRGVFLAPILALCFVLALACSGMAPKPPPSGDYVGTWTGPGVTLEVKADGMVEYSTSSGGNFQYSGPVSSWDGGKMTYLFGDSTIDAPPAAAEGTWTMTVDGVKLTRQ